MPEQQPAPLNFWWPTSPTAGKVMLWLLGVIGLLVFIKGGIDENLGWEIESGKDPAGTIASILFFYVALNLARWYFICNICRFVYHRINRSETIQTMHEARREKAELESLRRKREIRQLKDELSTNTGKNGTQ